MQLFLPTISSSLLDPNTRILNIPFSNPLNLSSPRMSEAKFHAHTKLQL
jgi:hypothetical protein